MIIKKFEIEKDLKSLENYLREQYLETNRMTSWLPERLHDLIYRMDTQYLKSGKEKSSDYIFIWYEEDKIVGCILPDGDAIYISTRVGYDHLFEEIVKFAEENCGPLFEEGNHTIDFLVVTNDSQKERTYILQELGYKRQEEEDHDNYVYPQEIEVTVDLPDGYELVYGDQYPNEIHKWSACNLGFHPDLESPDYENDMAAYNTRKNSSMYQNSFECLVIDKNTKEKNNVCSYCFVYVDLESKTAFIEPVSTREKYRHQGIGTAMMHGVMLKCKELGIKKCYVNSYDWRVKFYNAAGFITEDTIGFWHKKINKN